MPSLVDVARQTDTVHGVPVYGVSAKGIAYLLGKFPELRALMAGRTVEVEQLMAMGGDAIAAIIAAGCGHPGNAEEEAAAALFSADTQADFLEPILRLTMPKGVGPFVEKVTALAGTLGDVQSMTAPAPKSSKRSTNSSVPATTKDDSGTVRLDS